MLARNGDILYGVDFTFGRDDDLVRLERSTRIVRYTLAGLATIPKTAANHFLPYTLLPSLQPGMCAIRLVKIEWIQFVVICFIATNTMGNSFVPQNFSHYSFLI